MYIWWEVFSYQHLHKALETYLLDYKASHAMSDEDYRILNAVSLSERGFPPNRAAYRRYFRTWWIPQLSQQSLAKIIDVEAAVAPVTPVGVVPEAMGADMFRTWVCQQLRPGPEQTLLSALTPRFPRSTPQSMDEDKIEKRSRGIEEGN